ncbi:primase C-terminal domain-containing protein [Mesorhizobium sp. ISC15]|uniref:primase C-terminal domain-containing protein n=1 Tax=Mesorhizobium sp. ISC15 TaxID=3076429 RepID=UPI00301C3D56
MAMDTVLHHDSTPGPAAKLSGDRTATIEQAAMPLPQSVSKIHSFGKMAERALDSGFLPVPMEGKQPMIRWKGRPLGKRAIANLLANPAIAAANIGFRTGELVAIDVDYDDDATSRRIMHLAFAALGETPIVRVGRRPRQMLFYRSREPIASTSIGKVEILGAGKIATVGGNHPDTGEPYRWPEGCLFDADLSEVPLTDALEVEKLLRWLKDELGTGKKALGRQLAAIATKAASRAASSAVMRPASTGPVREGERNNTLFRLAMKLAVNSRAQANLLDAVQRENSYFLQPLEDKEVEGIVESVWSYRRKGRLFVKGKQVLVLPINKDEIFQVSDRAFKLLGVLKLTRTTTRRRKTFTIPQKDTAKRLRWGSDRVKKGIDELLCAGYIRIVRQEFHAQIEYDWGHNA